jgi:chromosome partitioning protein
MLLDMLTDNQESQTAWQQAFWKARRLARNLSGNLACWARNMLARKSSLRYGRHMMLVFANTKGGVGKSTLAVHLAVWLHDRGFKTALLDGDKQRSSSEWLAEAEPKIEIRTADTPDECVLEARRLMRIAKYVVADGPAGLDDISRALLILADAAFLPVTPSILDIRSVQHATSTLQKARGINAGRPEWFLVLNKIRRRDTISNELRAAAPQLGIRAAKHAVRDLQAFRDAAQQATVVTRMGQKAAPASADITRLFSELVSAEISSKLRKGKLEMAYG